MNIFFSLLLAIAQLFSNPTTSDQKNELKSDSTELIFSEELPPFSNCPASPYPTQVVQPDNSFITIIGKGNMVNSWTETVDGYTIVRNSSGIYEYAHQQNGNLVPSGVKANDPSNRSTTELNFIANLTPSLKPALSPLKQSILSQVQRQNLQKTFPTTGNINVVALLIDYPDLQSTFAKSNFDSLLYGSNYRNGDGSFKYFYETASDSLITINVDVFGWYRAANGYLYYGRDSGFARAADLAREAVNAAETAGVNFANYDNDSDGDVDGILVVHSGPGAEQGSRTQYIWSHRWVLAGGNLGSVTYDGKFINDYMMNPETRIAGLNQNLVGIGVFCHEFGHNIGLPDLYDTDPSNGDSEGIGNWCLMSGGTWLGGEHRPSNFSAWCRIENNWATPTTLTVGSSNGSYTMNPSVNDPNAIYQINTPLSNEYFLLENRQKLGLDRELPGEGLAIWHINTTKTNAFGNSVNADENLKGVDLEAADGNNDMDNEVNRGDNGDLFPGSSNNRVFADTTNPNSKTYLNGNTNILIRNITENGNLLSFDFGPAPVVTCTGVTTLTAGSGTFDDGSGSAASYANNLNCSWLIQPNNGPITLNFNRFDVDALGDTLYVFDGRSNGSPLLGKYTGSVIPPSITSSGDTLLLEFRTNGLPAALGWEVSYTTGSSLSTCSGTTNLPAAQSGSFDDGSGPGVDYDNNLNCSWLIDATLSSSVMSLVIDSLDIEATNDSLIIYEGQNNTTTPIAIITDNSQAAVLNINSRFAFVEFKTNSSVTARGWQISWQGTNGCAGADTLTAFSGTFSDGTLPTAQYANGTNCEWLIQPAGATAIQLDFNRFRTESGFDFVEVYDGPTTASPRLARLSGGSIPSTILSSGGVMLVRFTSDFSITDQGFEARYVAFNTQCLPLRTFTGTSGTFSDGSGASNYSNNLNCGWLIQPNFANSITLSFSAFDTESNNDVVTVYDGVDNSGTVLATLSGNTIPSNVVLNGTSVSMYVEFTTNGSTTAAGWDASYTATIGTTCSGTTTLTAPSGTFDDGSGPGFNYNNNLNCGWLIQPPGSPSVITLDFSFFNLQFGDFVRIYDGTSNAGTLIGTRTGTFSGATLSAFSGAMFVELTTNGSLTAPGFTANYNSSNTFCVPNITLTTNFGTLSDGSPFAQNYANNTDCEWLIQPTAPNVAVRLTFNRFSTEAGNDTVTVYDGATTSDPILGTYSGSSIPPVNLSSGGSMLVTFKSNGSNTSTGWQGFYQTQPIPACAGTTTLNATSGTFNDGSAPTSNYVDNSNCNWLIQPSGASRVSLQFNRFNLGNGDVVNVYDGNSASAPLLGSFVGTNIPPLVVSSGNSLFVNFTANAFQNSTGWEASYSSTTSQCFSNLTLTNFRDTIEDGSGSVNYANNLSCNWLISPTSATSIDLDFTQFDLAAGDSLKIYDGTSNAASLIVALSGSTLPSTVSSTGGDMFLEFTTNGSGTAAGWKGFYDINSSLSCVGVTTLTAPSGSFTDGSGTSNYDNNLNCGWLIQPSGNPVTINLNFTSMSTANFNDRVFIYDGTSNAGAFLGTLFGTNTGGTFTANSGSMFVEFNTDGFGTAAGWAANYTSSSTYCSPTTTLTGNFGQISDGSPFTQNYLDNTSCQWLIQPGTPNTFITLNFFQFNTEAGNDTVTIYDGSTTADPIIATYSGTNIPPSVFSTGNTMLVTFNTNGSVTAQGWRGSYNVQPIPSCLGLTTLTAASGTFDDGSGPASYDNNLNCSWLIQPPGALSVDLTFNSFNTQQTFDVLNVYDGTDNTGTLLGSYSGNPSPPTLTASSGSMFLEFTTNFTTTARGWNVSYTSSTVPILDVIQDTIFINAALGSQNTFNLNANVSWTITENAAWLVTNPTSGSGTRSVSAIAIQPNIGPTRYVDVIVNGSGLSDTVVVAQRSSGRFLLTSPDTLYYQSTPLASQMASITSNVSWSLSSPDTWVSIGTNSGSNNGSTMISVNTNNSNQIRTGYIVAIGTLGASNDTIWVVQDSMPADPPNLTVNPGTLTLAMPMGSSATFDVNSNVSWQTSTPASWINIQNPQVTMDTNTVQISANSMNTTGTDRSSYVAVQDVAGTLFDTVFVTQTGGPVTLTASPDTITLANPAGSLGIINVSSNANWTTTSSTPNFFTYNPNTGSGNGTITVSAVATWNLAVDIIGYIAFQVPGGSSTDTVYIRQEAINPSLSPSPKILNLAQTANSTDSSIVSSNTVWLVDVAGLPTVTWMTFVGPLTPTNGQDTVRVTAISANNDPNTRSTFIPISDVTQTIRDTIFINQAGTNPILEANQDTVMLSAMMASTANVTFLSNGNWTATEGDTWFSANTNSGSGPGNLTLTANSANTNNSQRVSYLALADATNGLADTVVVIQDTAQVGVQASPDTLFLSHLANSGGMINLNSSVSCTATATAGWLTVSPSSGSGDQMITVRTVTQNPSFLGRIARVGITDNSNPSVTDTVVVIQNGTPIQLSVNPRNVVLNSTLGSNSTLTVTSNNSWTISNPASWLDLSASNGSNNATITVTANSDNLTGSNRVANLTFNSPGVSPVIVTVTQIDGTSPQFVFSEDTVFVDFIQGSTADFSIFANQANWSLSENTPWLLVNPAQGNGTAIVNVLAASRNAFGNERTAMVIGRANGFSNDTVIVVQRASNPLFQAAPSDLDLGSDSTNTVNFNISSNLLSWTIEENESWVQVMPDSGSFTQRVTVMATQTNRSGAIRSGVLTIISPPQVPLTVNVTQDTVRAVGLGELSADMDISIYPNPARDKVIIEGINIEKIDLAGLRLFNSMGQEVVVNFVRRSPSKIEMELGNQPQGIYYLNYSENEIGISRKLILLR